MTDKQYLDSIHALVKDGRGLDAIRDICVIMRASEESEEKAMRELQAEKRAIRKICGSENSPKQKVDAIKALVE